MRCRLVRVQRPVETSLGVVIFAAFLVELFVLRSPARLRIVYGLLVAAWILFIAYEAVVRRSPWLGAAGLVAVAAAQLLQAVPASGRTGCWCGSSGSWARGSSSGGGR
ncbi:MAG TPA: hypothetical protein VKF59_17980 [Candidatus Dormibacteraeota bacterium]|nr:hypothetical protein [Candidatus Dormibacteraeota bacterium]